MVKFECTRCGKCCMSFGNYIKQERELTETDYYCRFSLTNEIFLAHVDSESRDLFLDGRDQGNTEWCPFLRKKDEGFACTIYNTRPRHCREFRCYSMKIFDANGDLLGRVGGKRSLLSSDDTLNLLWKEKVSPLKAKNDREWREKVKGTLETEGYRVMIYE